MNLGQDLDKHCLRYLKKANNANEAECKRAWTKICDQTFRDNDEIILINKTIDKYNLMVPMLQSQKFHLNLDKELDKGKYFTKKVKNMHRHEKPLPYDSFYRFAERIQHTICPQKIFLSR